MAAVPEIAIIGYAQSPSWRRAELTEPQFLFPVISDAIDRAGIERRDIGFTCAGSCDYLSGQTFAFVMNLEAVGVWPPISESHVEMDGAWALYEAWVRLHHGDIDTALVFGSGKSSPGVPAEIYPLQMDPYTLTPLGIDPVSIAALQARAMLDRGLITEREMAETAAAAVRRRRAIRTCRSAATSTSTRCSPSPTSPHRSASTTSRRSPTGPPRSCSRPRRRPRRSVSARCGYAASTTGSRSTSPGCAISRSRRRPASPASRRASARGRSMSRSCRPASRTRRRSCGTRSGSATTSRSTRRAARAANPMMAVGLSRVAEAARQVAEHGKHRAVAHATSGQALQQNLVCVLEGD